MPSTDTHAPGTAEHRVNSEEMVWLPIAEAASRLKCDPGTIRRRFNNPNYTFKYERREVYGGVEYGIPKAELDAVDATGNAGHAAAGDARQPETMPSDAEHAPHGDAGHSQAHDHIASEWREDLLAQIEILIAENASLQEDKSHLRSMIDKLDEAHHEELGRLKSQLEESQFENKSKDAKIEVLEVQLSQLETELRETLRESEQRSTQLAHRIADLVQEVEQNRTRVYELAPLAKEVPRLQAAVEEREVGLIDAERELAQVRQIESGRLTGPIYRLLQKKVRR
ncbi:MAG: hypothetical protein O3A46_00120 [Candidatus Poribacteria bacterium]|nr:hypothetical protein [Candidatus Poribacteria bacterium]